MSLSICANEMQLIRVAEHLGASSRRPHHPFPALMAGETPGRVPVYTALKTHPVHELQLRSCTTWTSTTCTATLALQLELEVVVVVGANSVVAADPIIEHTDAPNVLLVLVISSRVVVVVWANFVIAAEPEIQHATKNCTCARSTLMVLSPNRWWWCGRLRAHACLSRRAPACNSFNEQPWLKASEALSAATGPWRLTSSSTNPHARKMVG